MTKEEFELREYEWSKRLEFLLIEMGKFRDHNDLLMPLLDYTPATQWYSDATQVMRDSFEDSKND